jgi:hypothetical protein
MDGLRISLGTRPARTLALRRSRAATGNGIEVIKSAETPMGGTAHQSGFAIEGFKIHFGETGTDPESVPQPGKGSTKKSRAVHE